LQKHRHIGEEEGIDKLFAEVENEFGAPVAHGDNTR